MDKSRIHRGMRTGSAVKSHWSGVRWALRFGLWRGTEKDRPRLSFYILPDAIVRVDKGWPGDGPHRWVYPFKDEAAKASYLEMILFNQQPQEETK